MVQGPAGELFNFTKIGYTTENSFALAYVNVPPNAGPPGHIHRWTNEWLYFPEGGIVFFTNYQQYPDLDQIPNGCQLPKTDMHRYLTKPGDLIHGPPFYVHGYRNEDNVSHPVINVWAPDVISQYFINAGQVLTDSSKVPPVGAVNKKLFVAIAPLYGISMSPYWDEYAASWSDDLQPPLGMNASGQELLDLLSNITAQNVTFPAPFLALLGNTTAQNVTCQSLSGNTTTQSVTGQASLLHIALLQQSFVFMYSIVFIVIKMFFAPS